jgi:hypothetical protein
MLPVNLVKQTSGALPVVIDPQAQLAVFPQSLLMQIFEKLTPCGLTSQEVCHERYFVSS